MIIDFHTHIFPKALRNNREKYFQSETAFKLLYSSPGSHLVGAKELIASMDKQNIDISVVFGFPWRHDKTFKMHNDFIMESIARYPQRLIGFCCIDPFNKNAVKESLRCLEGGLSGIGELAFYQSGIDKKTLSRLEPFMEICLDKDLPILIHTNEPVGHHYAGKTPITMYQIYSLLKRFPKNKIVLAHWGGGIFFFNLLKKDVKESLENVYFDTAASPFLYDPDVYQIALQIVGPNKILFGSDFPLIKPSKYFKEFKEARLPKKIIEHFIGENAAKLLKL